MGAGFSQALAIPLRAQVRSAGGDALFSYPLLQVFSPTHSDPVRSPVRRFNPTVQDRLGTEISQKPHTCIRPFIRLGVIFEVRMNSDSIQLPSSTPVSKIDAGTRPSVPQKGIQNGGLKRPSFEASALDIRDLVEIDCFPQIVVFNPVVGTHRVRPSTAISLTPLHGVVRSEKG
jgi:hypothetical protein